MQFPNPIPSGPQDQPKVTSIEVHQFADDIERLMRQYSVCSKRTGIERLPKYGPMSFLLDDSDFRSLGPSPELFARWRAGRRRIYVMYMREFRDELREWLRNDFLRSAETSRWERVFPSIGIAAARSLVLAGFVAAWLLHGLKIDSSIAIVKRVLQIYRSTLPKLVAIDAL